MSDRQPEPWESSKSGPFCTIWRARGTVEVWARGGQRFRVKAPEQALVVEGHDAAMQVADELAEQLG
jgi:hypothetical protein